MKQSNNVGNSSTNGAMDQVEIEPFTQRWIEAGLLLDCLSIKV